MKQTEHNEPVIASMAHLIHEAVAIRAQELWMRAGNPDHQSKTNWLGVEAEFLSERRLPRPDPLPMPVSF